MKTRFLLAAMIATGLALAPAAFAADDMSKDKMSKEKMEKKTHVQNLRQNEEIRRHEEGQAWRRTT